MRSTVSDLLGYCYGRLNYTPTPPPTVTTRLLSFLNDAEDELLSTPGLSALLQSTITFASTADQAVCPLPPSVGRIIAIRDTSNQWRLKEVTADSYYQTIPNTTANTGTPDRYAVLGERSVALDPSDASELFLISSSASDTQVAHYEVILSTGQRVVGHVTVTGTSAVSLSASLTSIVQCVDLYLNSAAVGTIQLREDSGSGTVLSTIYANTLASAYLRIGLIPTPASALTYTLDYERARATLVNGTDSSLLPQAFHRLLPIGVLVREYQDKGDRTRYEMAMRDWILGKGALNAYVASPPDLVVVPGDLERYPSVLGPWTPYRPYRGA